MYDASGQRERSDQITRFMPVVRRHALKLLTRLPATVDLDDLIQAGVVGLIEALDRYDPSSGYALATFASQRINGAMVDDLRRRDWLPRKVRREGREVSRTIAELEQRFGRPPSEREIADEMEMPIQRYQQLLGDINNGLLVDYFEDDAEQPGESAPPDDEGLGVDPLTQALAAGDSRALADAVEKLPEREKRLLGFIYQEGMNLKEIGAVLEVSLSRVSQLHSQAIGRLRAQMMDPRE